MESCCTFRDRSLYSKNKLRGNWAASKLGRSAERIVVIFVFLTLIICLACTKRPLPYMAYLGPDVTLSPEKGRPLQEVAVLIIDSDSISVRCIRGTNFYVRDPNLSNIGEIHLEEGTYTVEAGTIHSSTSYGGGPIPTYGSGTSVRYTTRTRFRAITNEYKKGHVYSIDGLSITDEGSVQEWAKRHPEYENATGDWKELRGP